MSRPQGRERGKGLALAKHMQSSVPRTEAQLTVTQAPLQQKGAILNISVPNKCFEIHKAKGNRMQQETDRFTTMARDCGTSQQLTEAHSQDTAWNGTVYQPSHLMFMNTSPSRQQ